MNRFPLSARRGAPSPASAARVEVTSPAHYISRKLVARGGTPFVHQPVEIIDPDTGRPVGDPVTTDAEGNVFVRVPEDKAYAIRIVDDDEPDDPPPGIESHDAPDSDIDATVLAVRLVDPAGAAIANESWEATGPGGRLSGTTDAEGDVGHEGVAAGVYELTVRGHTYKVHTLYVSDLDPERPNKLVVR